MSIVPKLWSPAPKVSARLARIAVRARTFGTDNVGATAIEYSLLGSCIAVTIAGICGMMFSKLSTEYAEIGNVFS